MLHLIQAVSYLPLGQRGERKVEMGGFFVHSGSRCVKCETKWYLKFELGKKIHLKEVCFWKEF